MLDHVVAPSLEEKKSSCSLLNMSSFVIRIMVPYVKPVDVGSLAVVCKELKNYLSYGWRDDAKPLIQDLFDTYRQQQCFDCFVKGTDFKDCRKVFSRLEFVDLVEDLPFYRYVLFVVHCRRLCSFYDHVTRGICDVFDVPKARGYVYGLNKVTLARSCNLSDVWLRVMAPHGHAEVRRRKTEYLEVHAKSR